MTTFSSYFSKAYSQASQYSLATKVTDYDSWSNASGFGIPAWISWCRRAAFLMTTFPHTSIRLVHRRPSSRSLPELLLMTVDRSLLDVPYRRESLGVGRRHFQWPHSPHTSVRLIHRRPSSRSLPALLLMTADPWRLRTLFTVCGMGPF